MIHAYVPREGAVDRVELQPGQQIPDGAVWLDLFAPSDDERRLVDRALFLELPTREEMLEIEPSSRLYVDGAAVYMTSTIITHADAPNPSSDVVTFVLTRHQLVTLRFEDPKPLRNFAAKLVKQPGLCATAEDALLGIIDAFIDRIADILEKVALDLDGLSQAIFREGPAGDGRPSPLDLKAALRTLGRNEDLASTSRDSLLSMSRMLRFLSQTLEASARKDQKARLRTMFADLEWLSQHSGFEANKVQFLLDATLGLINIEQNAIIKIFSVAAVVFLPPTLVASIYGMNFDLMPELKWAHGYPFALGLMVVSAVLPYLFFKRKGWL
jgi:magnesium transporter